MTYRRTMTALPQTNQPTTKPKKKILYFLKLSKASLVKDGLEKSVGGSLVADCPLQAPDSLPFAMRLAAYQNHLLQPATRFPPAQILCGELASDVLLDQLSALSSEVFLPLIANRSNTSGGTEKSVPEVVAKNVVDGLQKFVATGQPGTSFCPDGSHP